MLFGSKGKRKRGRDGLYMGRLADPRAFLLLEAFLIIFYFYIVFGIRPSKR